MSLNDSERKTLVDLYLGKAYTTYQDAIVAAEATRWSMAANRLFYSLFHAATALFVNDGISVGSHRGVKAKLGQHYILPGKMDAKFSQYLAQMETLRDKADYNIMFEAAEADVMPNLPIAKAFIEEVERLVRK